MEKVKGGKAGAGITGSSQQGLKDGWTRATFILRKDYVEKIKALAYWERKKVKEVIDEALEAFVRGRRIKQVRNR